MRKVEKWTCRISLLYSCIVKHLKPPSKFSLFIVLHPFCAISGEHKTNAGDWPNLKHDRFPSFSDGFIYFDYRPPSKCWPSPLQAGNGNGMGNRSSLVTFSFFILKGNHFHTAGACVPSSANMIGRAGAGPREAIQGQTEN